MSRVQLFAILGALAFLLLILELVRRRSMREQYSLLWLLTGGLLLAFGLWRRLVDVVGSLLGIYYGPAALILVFTLFFMIILLHFTTVISQLTRQNRTLAQRVAILEWSVKAAKTREAVSASESGTEG
jgi:hypothetical protein